MWLLCAVVALVGVLVLTLFLTAADAVRDAWSTRVVGRARGIGVVVGGAALDAVRDARLWSTRVVGRARGMDVVVVGAALNAVRASHRSVAHPASSDAALAALRPLLALLPRGASVGVEQAMRSQCDGRTKHLVLLTADARHLRRALYRLCGEEVGEETGALYGRRDGVVWVLREVEVNHCIVVRISSPPGLAWTSLLREEGFQADRAASVASGSVHIRCTATFPGVDFERAAAFFTKGEELADANVERWVVTEQSETRLTVFTQFFGLWPIVGPRHQTVTFTITRPSPTQVVMTGGTGPNDGAVPSPTSMRVKKTTTIELSSLPQGGMVLKMVELVDAKLPTKTVPDWVCVILAKKLRARMVRVRAHLSD